MSSCAPGPQLTTASLPPSPLPTVTAAPSTPTQALAPSPVASATNPPSPTSAPATSIPVLTPSPTAVAPSPTPAGPPERTLRCGDVVRESLKLANDLQCSKDALVVEASDITLDLNGRTLRGPGQGTPTWPRPNLQSVGVRVTGQRNVVVRNGTIEKFSSGILLARTNRSLIETVTTYDNYYGVYLEAAEGNLVRDSTFRENVYGPTLFEAHGNRLEANRMIRQRHLSPGGYGVYIYGSRGNTVVGNTIESNVNWGIWLSSSENNVFFHNNVVDNRPQVSDDSGGNIWHDARSGEGNYWADWEGQELSGTGIGNHPYRIWGPGGAVDPYPFVRRDGWREPNRRPAPSPVAPRTTPRAESPGPWVGLPAAHQVASTSSDGTRLERSVSLGEAASNLAPSADGRTIYVVDGAPGADQRAAGLLAVTSRAIVAVDARTGLESRRYPLGSTGPTHLVPDRDGQHLHVLDGGSVATLDLKSGAWRAPLTYPATVAASFASWKHQLLLIANQATRGIDLVWIGGRRISYTIPTDGAPATLAANRAGTRLYTSVPGQDVIQVIETEQYAVVDRLRPEAGAPGWLGLAVSPEGGRLFALSTRGDLFGLDLPGGTVRYRQPLGPGAISLAASPDGQRLFVGMKDDTSTGRLLTLRAADGIGLAMLRLPAVPADLVPVP